MRWPSTAARTAPSGSSGSAKRSSGKRASRSHVAIPEIDAASPVAVAVDAFEDVTILESGTGPGCSDCNDAWNYVVMFDGYEWSTIEDPDHEQGAARALASLSDGRIAVVGNEGYLRVVEHGVWTSMDLGTSTSLRGVAELTDGSLLIVADGGLLFVGTLDAGFERIRTDWEGDFTSVLSDGVGGAWILGVGDSWDDVHVLRWNGTTLAEVGAPGPWWTLGNGPDGDARVVGGERGAAIATASDAGVAIEWSLDGVAPVANLAVATNGVAYSAADGFRGGVIGEYDGQWQAIELGDIRSITLVEAMADGDVLFATDDGNAWRWDGTTAFEEVLPIPGVGHNLTAFALDEDRAVVAATWYDQAENRDNTLVVRDADGVWSEADIDSLPGEWLFAMAIDEDGVAWLSGYDDGKGYLASWTPEAGAQIVIPDLASAAYGSWPKAGGGLWVFLQGDPSDQGFYSFDGESLTFVLGDLGLDGVQDVVEHPVLGPIAAVTYDGGSEAPGPAIVVRDPEGTWSPIAFVDDDVLSLAVLPDDSILVGTWQGALRLSDCAWH